MAGLASPTDSPPMAIPSQSCIEPIARAAARRSSGVGAALDDREERLRIAGVALDLLQTPVLAQRIARASESSARSRRAPARTPTGRESRDRTA